jgi:hypothetical protein
VQGRFELTRPDGIDDDGWLAITEGCQRLEKVFDEQDHPAVLGTAKDLVESVAKVILVARGESPNQKNMPSLLTKVHLSLDSSAGRGRATEEPLRSMLQSIRTLIGQIAPMRNQGGTGHGRQSPSSVTAEHASVAADAAMTWCRWAVERFGDVHRSSPAWLIALLDTSIFYKDEVAGHLSRIDLDQLPDPDLNRVGRALAHRGGWRDTRVVWQDGVGAALREPERFPRSFRVGLLYGLFFSRQGEIETSHLAMRPAAQLAARLGDESILANLRVELDSAVFSANLRADTPTQIAASIRESANELPVGPLRSAWEELVERFEPTNDAE